ncbi:hypothetical protein Scep_017529 [Stephania cephalantha]|uniref:Uncharacterized protein n=1 Tax=Stephania cephalantha TaxID=152367 RepID=A0AAP0IPP9_9MAGN
MEKISNSVLAAMRESKPVEEGRRSVQRIEQRDQGRWSVQRERKLEKISPSRHWRRGRSRNRRMRWSVQWRWVACRGGQWVAVQRRVNLWV